MVLKASLQMMTIFFPIVSIYADIRAIQANTNLMQA